MRAARCKLRGVLIQHEARNAQSAMTEATTQDAAALLTPLRVLPEIPWYHLADPQSPVLDRLAEHFGIHPLQLEECREIDKTAHLEESESYSFIVIKLLGAAVTGRLRRKKAAGANSKEGDTRAASETSDAPMWLLFEDFNIFLGRDWLLTVSEGAGDSELVKAAVTRVTAKASAKSPDRIAHALIDIAVDRYLPVLDNVAEAISDAENVMLHSPEPTILR